MNYKTLLTSVTKIIPSCSWFRLLIWVFNYDFEFTFFHLTSFILFYPIMFSSLVRSHSLWIVLYYFFEYYNETFGFFPRDALALFIFFPLSWSRLDKSIDRNWVVLLILFHKSFSLCHPIIVTGVSHPYVSYYC